MATSPPTNGNSNGNQLPPLPPPPEQSPRWPEGALPRRQAQAEYVAGGGNWIAESPYYRSLPTYIDDITRDFGSDAYERVMLDDQVASSVRTYVESILSDPLTVRPWIDDDKDPDYEKSKQHAEFSERLLANCSPTRSIDALLFEMTMGSVSLGNRVAEKVARLEESGQDAGRLVWDRVKVKPRNRTAFVVDGFSNLLGLLAAIPGQGNLVPGAILTPDLLAVSNLLPREKFAILSWNPQEEDPRGTSLLRTVYRLWWEKIQATAEWLRHLTQFGSPSLWGTTAPDAMAEPATDSLGNLLPGGASISPVQQLLNELLKFRNGYALALPNGSTLQLLQSANAGDSFLKMVEHHERAIDRAILLAARTRMEAKHGSKADSETSQDITGQAVRRAKTWVADMVTRDLIRPMILWNFGPDAAKRLCPYASLAPVEHQDWSQTANAVAPLVSVGFLKPSQFAAMYDKLGLPPAEEPLTDDQQQGTAPPPAPGDEDFPAAAGTTEAPFAAGEYQEPLHPRGYGGKWASKGGDHGHEQHTEQLTWRGKVASLLRQALSQPGKSVARVLAAAEALHDAYREGGFRAVPKVAVLAAYRKAKVSFAKLETRYGRKVAIAMAGAYLSCYAAYAANPVLMLYLPSPTAAIIGTAEALRALGKGARKLAGKKGEAVFAHPDILPVDLEDFLDSMNLEDAEFAFGLPTPYEEGKHPRGYGGKWTNKPGAGRFAAAGKAHQAAEKELQKHERALARSAAKLEKLKQAHETAKAAHAEAKKRVPKGKPHSREALEAHKAELAALRAKGKLDAHKAAHAEARKAHRAVQAAHAKTGKEFQKAQAALDKEAKKPARKPAEKKPVAKKEPVEKKSAAREAAEVPKAQPPAEKPRETPADQVGRARDWGDQALPDGARLAGGHIEALEDIQASNIFYKVTLGEQSYFVKQMRPVEWASSEDADYNPKTALQKETTVRDLAKIVDVRVPPIRAIDFQGQLAVVMPFLKEARPLEDLVAKGTLAAKVIAQLPANEVGEQLLFGYLAGVSDRHMGNYLVQDNHLLSIDHEYSLGSGVWASESPRDEARALIEHNRLYSAQDQRQGREFPLDQTTLRAFVAKAPAMQRMLRDRGMSEAAERLAYRAGILQGLGSQPRPTVGHLLDALEAQSS